MKLHLIGDNLFQNRITRVSILLFFIVCTAIVLMFLLSNTVVAFRPRQTTSSPKSLLGSQAALLPIVVASPTASNSTSVNGTTTSSQDSQAQNDLSIANTIITWAGVVIAVAGLVLAFLTIGGAIAGFFGVRELGRIRNIRKTVTTLEQKLKDQQQQLAQATQATKDLANSKDQLEQELKGQQQQLAQATKDLANSKDQLVQLTGESETLEKRLKQLDQEIKNKRFLEASYYYIEGTNAYKIGNNELAIKYYELVLDLQPQNTLVMERLGRAYSNLNDMNKAIDYLENQALTIDPSFVPALRSLALCYRYTDKDKAIEYFQRVLKIDPSDYETWDFLGLLYRDNKLIDEAISAHKHALDLKRRPETQFYLSILYALRGDYIRAKSMALSAYQDTFKQDNDERIRPVWKILIHAAIPIMDGNKGEALELIHRLSTYITTQRICDAVTGHLQFLLEATDHKDWTHEILDIVKVKQNVAA